MDSSKVSLSLCGENVLYIGSSIAHHCNFNTLRSATGAHITTRKAYGTVFDENMFFPHSNLTDVVELEVADRKPAVLVLQSSSVDITVLKEKRLSYNEMAKAAKKSSTDIFTLAVKMSAYPFLKRIIVSERTPRIIRKASLFTGWRKRDSEEIILLKMADLGGGQHPVRAVRSKQLTRRAFWADPTIHYLGQVAVESREGIEELTIDQARILGRPDRRRPRGKC